ncbi:nitroreductase [Nocardioides jishulii]|uniref:nitroreductase n=1 Tax=Nocardioides jishulii TaxID=2575440 RepID=UPI001EF11695|nr:nitroreductase [Nocardioides jishulii]
MPPTASTTLTDLLAHRHSARAFTDREVPREVIDDVLAKAQRSPSWCNTQPWQVHVLSGGARDRFSKALVESALGQGQDGEQGYDLGTPTYTGVHAERRRESGYALYAALGIERSDREARFLQSAKNLDFFGAPHVLVLTTDAELGTYGAVDAGGWLTVLMLLLAEAGVGSIAQGAIAMYSDVVRDFLDLGEDRRVVCAVSFGYEDAEDPVNAFRTSRAPMGEVVHHLTD